MNHMDPIAAWLGPWSMALSVGAIFLRLSLSLVLSAFIGWERTSKRHSAGMRSFMLVGVAATGVMILDSAHPDILQRYDLPDYLSYDRAASLLAVRYLFKGKPCIVFDFGTTLTIDLTSEDGQYRGGNVSPGFTTRFKALNRYSKALPLMNIPTRIPHEGNSLESSIESGVVSGIMFEIEGYIRRHPGHVVVFTGGDATYFAKRMKQSLFIVSNLVQVGLALITDDYVEKNIQ